MSINRRVDKLLSSHTQGQYTLKIKENELLIDAPTWINRTDRTLKEARHYSTLCVILLCAMNGKNRVICGDRTQNSGYLLGEVLIRKEHDGTFWNDGKVVYLDLGGSCMHTHTHKYVKIH